MRRDHYAISCFIVEVSQASHIQDEDITPLKNSNVFRVSYLNSIAKLPKNSYIPLDM